MLKNKDYCTLWCNKYTNLDYKILKSTALHASRHQKFSKLLRR